MNVHMDLHVGAWLNKFHTGIIEQQDCEESDVKS